MAELATVSKSKILDPISERNCLDWGITFVQRPKFTEYKLFTARLNSFPDGWKWNSMTAREFVEGGFFYVGMSTNDLRCYWCGIRIRLVDESTSSLDAFDLHHQGMSLTKASCLHWELHRPNPGSNRQGESVERSTNGQDPLCPVSTCRLPRINLYLVGCRHVIEVCPSLIQKMLDSNPLVQDNDVDLGGAGNAKRINTDTEPAINCPRCGDASVRVKRVFFPIPLANNG